MAKSNDLLAGIVRNIQKESPLYATYKFIEVAIAIEFADRAKDGKVEISQTDLCRLSTISADTARLVNKLLINSGRWEIITGTGRAVTTYKPLFLDNVSLSAPKGRK